MTGKPENRPLILTHQSRGQKDGRIKVGWGQPDVLRWRQPALAAGKKEECQQPARTSIVAITTERPAPGSSRSRSHGAYLTGPNLACGERVRPTRRRP